MGKNIKYGEFTFPASPARPTASMVSTARSTRGIPKAMYDAPKAMKNGGYAKGGQKIEAKREPEAMVRKEIALLRKADSPKALIQHEVREIKGEKDTPATIKAEVGMLRKAKAPLTMIKEEMMEPTGMKKGGMAAFEKSGKDIEKRGVKEGSKADMEMDKKQMMAMKKGGMTKMEKKVGKVMGEFKAGDLHSGSKSGPVVKNRQQAIAIGLSEGRKASKMAQGGQYAADARPKMADEGKALNKTAKKFGLETQGYAKGGSVEAKLEKHANMPASKAHGPGAGNKLAKGGVPTFSKVPKFGNMK